MAISRVVLARLFFKSSLQGSSINGRSMSVWSGKSSTKSNHSKVLSPADGHLYELQGERLPLLSLLYILAPL